jgi:transcriptional regulator with XRE-family HTH domain
MNKTNNVYISDLKEYLIEKFHSVDLLRFTNIIDYAKSAYGISVIDLANLFDVTRATIYNYIDGKYEISKKVIDTIVHIYGVSTYRDVIVLERIPNFYRAKIELIEKQVIDQKVTDTDLAYVKPYQVNSQRKFEIRNETGYRDKWLLAVRNKQKYPDITAKDPEVSKMIQFMAKNSVSYNQTLVQLISQSRNNDDRLLNALELYLSDERKLGNLGMMTTEPRVIQKKIDELVSRKNSIIQVGYEDFRVFPKTHVQFKLKTLLIFDYILPSIEYQVDTIVLGVSSESDISLFVIDRILNSIYEKYGQTINVIYSISRSEHIDDDVLDLFFIE